MMDFPEDFRVRYLADGACLLRNALDADQIAFLREAVFGLIGQAPVGGEGVQPFFADDGTQVVKYDGGFYVEYLSRHCDHIRQMLESTMLPNLACGILDAEEVTFWRDEVHYKSANTQTNATPWHHGAGSFPFKGADALTIWIPITRVTIQDGPLQTVRESHLDMSKRFRPPTRTPSVADDGDIYVDVPNFTALNDAGTVDVTTWIMEPGDALAFHPYTVHGSLPNIAGSERIAYVSRWLGDDVRYEPDAYSVPEPAINASNLHDGRPIDPLFPRFRRSPAIA